MANLDSSGVSAPDPKRRQDIHGRQ